MFVKTIEYRKERCIVTEDLRRMAEIQDELKILKDRQKLLEDELNKLMLRTGGFSNVLNQLHPTIRKSLMMEGVTTDIQLADFLKGNWDAHSAEYKKCTDPEERIGYLRNVGPKRAKEAMLLISPLL